MILIVIDLLKFLLILIISNIIHSKMVNIIIFLIILVFYISSQYFIIIMIFFLVSLALYRHKTSKNRNFWKRIKLKTYQINKKNNYYLRQKTSQNFFLLKKKKYLVVLDSNCLPQRNKIWKTRFQILEKKIYRVLLNKRKLLRKLQKNNFIILWIQIILNKGKLVIALSRYKCKLMNYLCKVFAILILLLIF